MPFDPSSIAFLGGVMGSQQPSPVPLGFGQSFGRALMGGLGAQQQMQQAMRGQRQDQLRELLLMKQLTAQDANELQLVGDPSSGLGVFDKRSGTYKDIKPGNEPAKTRTVKRNGVEVTEEYDRGTMKWNPIGESPIWDPQRNALTPYQQAQLGLSREDNELARKRLEWDRSQPRDEPLVAIETPQGPRYVPRAQAAGMAPAASREGGGFKQAQDLRKEFTALTKDDREVVTSFGKIIEGFQQDSGPGDIAGIFGYMKMLDPGSVVREGEFATAQNSAGLPEQVRNMYNRLLEGDRLSLEARKQIAEAARGQIEPYRARYGRLREQFSGYAQQYGVDPNEVAPDLPFPPTPARQSPGQETSPRTTVAPPGQTMETPPAGQVAPPQPAPQGTAPPPPVPGTAAGRHPTVDSWLR